MLQTRYCPFSPDTGHKPRSSSLPPGRMEPLYSSTDILNLRAFQSTHHKAFTQVRVGPRWWTHHGSWVSFLFWSAFTLVSFFVSITKHCSLCRLAVHPNLKLPIMDRHFVASIFYQYFLIHTKPSPNFSHSLPRLSPISSCQRVKWGKIKLISLNIY